MSTQAPVPEDSPLMRAFAKYKASEEYANTFKWAAHEEYREGSLWSAFMCGMLAANPNAAESPTLTPASDAARMRQNEVRYEETLEEIGAEFMKNVLRMREEFVRRLREENPPAADMIRPSRAASKSAHFTATYGVQQAACPPLPTPEMQVAVEKLGQAGASFTRGVLHEKGAKLRDVLKDLREEQAAASPDSHDIHQEGLGQTAKLRASVAASETPKTTSPETEKNVANPCPLCHENEPCACDVKSVPGSLLPAPFMVFDVESVGLYGEGFAVAGGLYTRSGLCFGEFAFHTYSKRAGSSQFAAWHDTGEILGDAEDREWVEKNVTLHPTSVFKANPKLVRMAFWEFWTAAREKLGAQLWAECAWPVEARFLEDCVRDYYPRRAQGPYPLHEISSVMFAAGMDPMATYDRKANELPTHEPLADSRQSARLLTEAIRKIDGLPALRVKQIEEAFFNHDAYGETPTLTWLRRKDQWALFKRYLETHPSRAAVSEDKHQCVYDADGGPCRICHKTAVEP